MSRFTRFYGSFTGRMVLAALATHALLVPLLALGIPPETRYGRDGFSERVSAGQPVKDLFG